MVYDLFDPIDPTNFTNLWPILYDDNEKYEVKVFADVYRDVGYNIRFEGVHPPHIVGGSTELWIVQDGAEIILKHLSLRNWSNFEKIIQNLNETSFRSGGLWSVITLEDFIAYDEMLVNLKKLGFEPEPLTYYKLHGSGYTGTWKLSF